MFKISIATLLTLISLSISFAAVSGEAEKEQDMTSMVIEMLPAPNSGFEWVIHKNSAILKPSGWNEDEIAGNPDNKVYGAFAFSPEEFSKDVQFEHGFTAQILADFNSTNNLLPSMGSIILLKSLMDKHGEDSVLIFEDGESKLGKTFVFRYKDTSTGKTPIIVHKYLIASDALDAIHMFTYESSEEEWKENWKKYGEVIFTKIAVIPFLSIS